MKKSSKGRNFSTLPLDCVFEISTFIEAYEDFKGLILSIKGFHEYLVNYKPTNTSVVFPMYRCPDFSLPNVHNYSYVQNLRIVNEEEIFISSSLNISEVLSLFSKLLILTIENTMFLPNSHKPLLNLGSSCSNLRKLSLSIPKRNLGLKGLNCCFLSNLESLTVIGFTKEHEIFKINELEDPFVHFYFSGKLRKLKKLNLERVRFSKDFKEEKNLFDLLELSPTLESLSLFHSKIRGYPISKKRFPKLKRLTIADNKTIRTESNPMVREIELEKFSIHGQPFPIKKSIEIRDKLRISLYFQKSFNEISRFKTLRELFISFRCYEKTKETDFSVFKNLEMLTLCWESLSGDGTFKIEGMNKLKTLEIRDCSCCVSMKDLPSLSKLVIEVIKFSEWCSSKTLEFSECDNVNSIKILLLEGIETFPKGIDLSKVEELILCDYREGQKIRRIDGLIFKNLRSLRIESNKSGCDENLIGEFRNLNSLKYLNISYFKNQALGIQNFEGLSENISGEIERMVVSKKVKKVDERFQFNSKNELLGMMILE